MNLRLTVNRRELLDAASQAALIAPSNSPIKELTCTLLEVDPGRGCLDITATNLEVAIRRTLPLNGQADTESGFSIHAKLFASMLGKLGGEMVTLTWGENHQLKMESEKASYYVSVFPSTNYPRVEIPFPDDTIKVTGIPDVVQRTAFAASGNTGTPLLTCVYLHFTRDGLRATGSDGTCVISAIGDRQSIGDIGFMVPAASLGKLARLCSNSDIFSVGTTGKSIVFLKDHFVFSARLMEGRYVDIDKMTEQLKPTFTVLVDTTELCHAIVSTSTVASDNKIVFAFHDNRLDLHCAGTAGRSSVSLEIIPLTGVPKGEYGYFVGQLKKALRTLSGTMTLGIASHGVLMLSTEKAFYMQSAARTPGNERKRDLNKAA